jgi:peptide/nickel transport system permease protein
MKSQTLQIADQVARRVVSGLLVLVVVSSMIFLAVALLPGDFATEVLGIDATPSSVHALRLELGLDLPLYQRYFNWIGGIFRGDLGQSLASHRQISVLIGPRLYNTLFLAALAALIAVPIALALGLVSVLFRNTRFDRFLNLITLSTVSFPEFFIAYVMIVVFAVKLRWMPSISNVAWEDPLLTRLDKTLMPALVLSLVVVGHMMRMTRAAVTNLMDQPYIEMALLKGASRWRIIVHHALANAWAPIITVVIFNLAYLVVGVVVVEMIFVYPGLGQLMVDAVVVRDVPVIQACSLIFASSYILLNLVADGLAIVTNPRLLRQR